MVINETNQKEKKKDKKKKTIISDEGTE